jgi:hypothetical protein
MIVCLFYGQTKVLDADADAGVGVRYTFGRSD